MEKHNTVFSINGKFTKKNNIKIAWTFHQNMIQ